MPFSVAAMMSSVTGLSEGLRGGRTPDYKLIPALSEGRKEEGGFYSLR